MMGENEEGFSSKRILEVYFFSLHVIITIGVPFE